MKNDTWTLILLLAAVFGALMAIAGFSNRGSLDSIKSKDVGDGQHGTARWATPAEVRKTFRFVPFQPALSRRGWCWAVWERSRPHRSSLCLGRPSIRSSQRSCGSTVGSGPWWTVTTSIAS